MMTICMKNITFLAFMAPVRSTSTVPLKMHALHHRGQEVARIVTFERQHFHASRNVDMRGVNLDAGSV